MPGRSWRALPRGQPAATQARKHQSHGLQVTSAGRSGSSCRRGYARRATPAGKSEPGLEVGLAGQKLVCEARGAGEVLLVEEGAAAVRPHWASLAPGNAGGAAGPAPEAPWPLSCAPLLRRERLEPSEPRGPVAPAASVPWKRARRPPASAPTERLKRQPRRHRGLGEPLGAPSSAHALHSLPSTPRSGGWMLRSGEAAETQNKGLRSILPPNSAPHPSSCPPTHPTHIPAQRTHPNPAKQAKLPWLSPLVHQPAQNPTSCASAASRDQKKADFGFSLAPLAPTPSLGSPSEHRLGGGVFEVGTKRQLIESNLLPNRQLQDTSSAYPKPLVTQNGIIPFHLFGHHLTPFRHQSYKEEPTLLQTYSLLSFKPLPQNLRRSSQLRAPTALPEGNSVCSNGKPGLRCWPDCRGRTAKRGAVASSSGPRLCLCPAPAAVWKATNLWSRLRENKNLWCIVPSNKDSPGSEAIICSSAL